MYISKIIKYPKEIIKQHHKKSHVKHMFCFYYYYYLYIYIFFLRIYLLLLINKFFYINIYICMFLFIINNVDDEVKLNKNKFIFEKYILLVNKNINFIFCFHIQLRTTMKTVFSKFLNCNVFIGMKANTI